MTDKVQKIREEFKRLREQLQNKVEESDFISGEVFIINYFLTFIDSLQEEPAEMDFEQELYKAFGQVKDFTLGMRIAKWFYDMGKNSQEFVSDDLGEYINEISKQFPEVSFAKLSRIAVRVAKWQKEKDFQYVKKECERTGSCCDNDIAIEAAKRHPYYYASEMEAYANIGFKEGAMWQKEQMKSKIEAECKKS